MSSTVSKSRDILQYKKSQVRNNVSEIFEDPPFLDLAAVAPSPSRDYYRVYVTKSEVTLTQWRITHGPKSVPIEQKVLLESFEKDTRIPSEVGRVFGKDCVQYIIGLSRGHLDKIIHLPSTVLARVFQYIGIQQLKTVAPVCSKFANICRSDELWKRFYFQYGGYDTAAVETKLQADYLSWKSLFFINRLHLKIGNAERFPGLFSDRNIDNKNNNVILSGHHRHRNRFEGHQSSSPSNTSIGSSSVTQQQQQQQQQLHLRRMPTVKIINGATATGARESSSSNRAFVRTRTSRIIDGNLVPRSSANKINEHPKKGGGGLDNNSNSPRQKATRYTIVNNNLQESHKNPAPTTRKY